MAGDCFPQSAPSPEAPTQLPKVEVTATQQQTQMISIDRKVYNVGQDLQALTGSAADVLQKIPSVQVDIDGNVSLRGDSSVQILIDGHVSGLMGTATRGDVLSQLPADSIERIEVITTPPASFKPDGTAGIINIVLKKKHPNGVSGNLKLTLGNDRRYGTALVGGYSSGKYSASGMLNYRQDDRRRVATDSRNYVDPATGLPASTETVTRERTRPTFEIAKMELQDQASSFDRLSQSFSYTDRVHHRRADETDTSTIGGIVSSYDRLRDDPEAERDAESDSTYEHDFGRAENTLKAEFRWEHYTETENNHYSDIFTDPQAPSTFDTTKIFTNEPSTEASIEYSNAITNTGTLEAGVDRSDEISREDHEGANLDAESGDWINDPLITNNFNFEQVVTALYGTYRQSLGKFGIKGGLRFESADIRTEQVISAIRSRQKYLRLYPTLHLTYNITDAEMLQLNYSHRVHRPEGDDLNPFPEYQDPYNLREGNPNLRPEEVHSIEAGYQYKDDETTYLGTIYYKYSYNGFTSVSQYVNSTTLLTTEENLSKSQSGGLEFATTSKPWKRLSLDASANLFYNEINASNLGYGTNLSTFAWAGKMSAEFAVNDRTVLQLNGNYTAKRLTPQGYRLPTRVANFGMKHTFRDRKVTLVLTVSDLFDSLKEETKLNTPLLKEDTTRRRNSRMIYAGVIYSFGSAKKKKDEALQFDDAP